MLTITKIINELLCNEPISLVSAMNQAIDWCESKKPDERWGLFRGLDYDQTEPMKVWLEQTIKNEPPDEPLSGLYFGLFNPVYGDEATTDLYISGSYNEIEENCDENWLCDQDYFPETGYAHSKVLHQIYQRAYRTGGLGNDAEYPLCLAYGALVVKQLLKEADKTSLFLDKNHSIYVAVGYDDGDNVILGKITSEGWK